MPPKIKVGLLVGAVGLVLNVCVSAAMGICGPAVSLIGGAIAGFLAARQEKPATQGEGAKIGAISAAIAGALILIGQIIAAVGALALIQFSGMQIPFGQVPAPSADPATQAIFYLSGLGTGLCFGLIGIFLAALAGAGTGYLGAGKSTAN